MSDPTLGKVVLPKAFGLASNIAPLLVWYTVAARTLMVCCLDRVKGCLLLLPLSSVSLGSKVIFARLVVVFMCRSQRKKPTGQGWWLFFFVSSGSGRNDFGVFARYHTSAAAAGGVFNPKLVSK